MKEEITIYNKNQLNAKNISSLKEICTKREIKLPATNRFKKKFVDRILLDQQIKVPDIIYIFSLH